MRRWTKANRLVLRFAGSGAVTRDTKLVNVSGVLVSFDTNEEAKAACLSWCRAWVDGNCQRGEMIFLMQTALAGHNCANCVVTCVSGGAVLRFTST